MEQKNNRSPPGAAIGRGRSREFKRHLFSIQILRITIVAHHLNYNEQTVKCGFFTVKEKAWHKLVAEEAMGGKFVGCTQVYIKAICGFRLDFILLKDIVVRFGWKVKLIIFPLFSLVFHLYLIIFIITTDNIR